MTNTLPCLEILSAIFEILQKYFTKINQNQQSEIDISSDLGEYEQSRRNIVPFLKLEQNQSQITSLKISGKNKKDGTEIGFIIGNLYHVICKNEPEISDKELTKYKQKIKKALIELDTLQLISLTIFKKKNDTGFFIINIPLKYDLKDSNSIDKNFEYFKNKLFPVNSDWKSIFNNILIKQIENIRRPLLPKGRDLDIFVRLELIERKNQPTRKQNCEPNNPLNYDDLQEDKNVIVQEYLFQEFLDTILTTDFKKDVCLIGEAGAGKTTSLTKIAEYILREDIGYPIYISIASLKEKDCSVEKYCKNLLRQEIDDKYPTEEDQTAHIQEFLNNDFNQSKIYFILDGLDEIALIGSQPTSWLNDKLSQEKDWIKKKAKIIIASRLTTWDSQSNHNLTNYSTFRAKQFDNEQIKEYILKFFDEWKQNNQLGNFSELTTATSLIEKLKDTKYQNINEVVRNPLYLCLLCEMWSVRQTLPTAKAQLFQSFVNKYSERWNQNQSSLTQTKQRSLFSALAKIALKAMDNPSRFRLSQSFILDHISEEQFLLACQFGWLNLVDRYPTNDEKVYAFPHTTLHEFFAAKAIDSHKFFLNHQLPVTSSSVATGSYRLFDSQWKEVYLFWLGLDNKDLEEHKLALYQSMIRFESGIDCDIDFYQIKLYLLALEGITEYENCSADLKKAITDKIVIYIQDDRIKEPIKQSLIKIRTEEAVPIFVSLLKDKSTWVRSSLVEGLLQDQSEDVRSSLVEALGEIGSDKAIKELIPLLQDQSDSVRSSVVKALGKIGSEEVIPELIPLLQDEYERVRSFVVEALGKIGSEEVIPELIPLLQDQSKWVRLSVQIALGEIGSEEVIPELIPLLQDESNRVRRSVVEVLGEIGSEEVIPELIPLLQDQPEDVRESVVKALGKIGSEEVIQELIPLLQDQSEWVRYFVVVALGEIGSEEVIPELIPLLQDQPEDVRESVVKALGKIGSEELIPELIPLLQDESDRVRRSVQVALGKIGSEEVIQELIPLLQDQSEDVRSSVVVALREIGSDKAIKELIPLLQDKSTWVRPSVVAALREIGSEEVIEELIPLLQDQSEWVRRSVVAALREIGSEEVIEELIPLLQDQSDRVRRSVVAALGEIGSDKAIQELIPLLQDQSEWVQSSVVAALGEIGSDKAIQELIPLLQDQSEWVQSSVVVALAKIGSDKAIQELIPLLQDQSEWVQSSVVEALWVMSHEILYPVFFQQVTSSQNIISINRKNSDFVLLQEHPELIYIDASSLTYLTQEQEIRQEFSNLLFESTFSDLDLPEINSLPELKRQFLNQNRTRQPSAIKSIIIDNCVLTDTIEKICQFLQQGCVVAIAFITQEPIEPPLRGFLPEQENLESALKTWLEEI